MYVGTRRAKMCMLVLGSHVGTRGNNWVWYLVLGMILWTGTRYSEIYRVPTPRPLWTTGENEKKIDFFVLGTFFLLSRIGGSKGAKGAKIDQRTLVQ